MELPQYASALSLAIEGENDGSSMSYEEHSKENWTNSATPTTVDPIDKNLIESLVIKKGIHMSSP